MLDNQQPTHSALGVDLRGKWSPQGRTVEITQPEQLVTHGIRVSREAIRQTPGWGDEALKSYDDALELAKSGAPVRLHEEPHILNMYEDMREQAMMLASSEATEPSMSAIEIPHDLQIDLRGIWAPAGNRVIVNNPEDLGNHGIAAIPAHALEATWPNENANLRYQEALAQERSLHRLTAPARSIPNAEDLVDFH